MPEEVAPPPPSALRRFLQSSLIYGAVAMPAMWLFGGSRGLRLVGASAAVGAAVTALHATTGVQSLSQLPRPALQRQAPGGPQLGAPGPSMIDIMGGDV